MTDSIYNWGREKEVYKHGKRKKVPNQLTLTDNGLVKSDTPVYHKPYVPQTRSKGFMDYDPLANF